MITTRRMLSLFLLLALVGCVAAPMSLLDGRRQGTIDSTLYAVKIIAVDGSAQFNNPVQVAPGVRSLVIQADAGKGAGGTTQRAFAFKVEPCTRYYLAAKRATPVAADWSLVVDSKESVSGCNPEEELKKAGITGSSLK